MDGGEALPYLVHSMYNGIVRIALSHCAFSTSLVDFHTPYDQPFGPSARAFPVAIEDQAWVEAKKDVENISK